MAIVCPSCGKENKDGARACAFCPESFDFEDDPDRPRHKFKRFDPAAWPVTVWLGVLAVAFFVGWKLLMGVMNLGEEGAKNPINQMVALRTTVPNLDPTKVPGTYDAGAPKVEAKLKSSVADAAAHPDYWHLNGTVKDLVTLAPIAGADLVFQGKSGKTSYTTDETGHYEIVVPPLDGAGYKVLIKKDGYAKNYLNPAAENVPKMSPDDRQGLAHDLGNTEEGPYEVQATSPEPLTTDFYLAPKPGAAPGSPK